MACLAENLTRPDFPEFGFTVDESVDRIREHSLALDRCKRFTEIPRCSFECGLSPLEWAVFAYYYSLAPGDHPSELAASTQLKIGRKTLAATLKSLSSRGMVFFDTYSRSKLKIVHIAHPACWNRTSDQPSPGSSIDPATHKPRLFAILPDRINDARIPSHAPGNNVRLPYLLFQSLIHPSSKFLYGLFCYLGINTHPTVKQLATALQCVASTVLAHIAELEAFRMIYSESREPARFGEHTRYYYHLTDVAFWNSRKAGVWYPGGENSLIVRLDMSGSVGRRGGRHQDELEDFRLARDTSQVIPWPELRQVSSQIRRDAESADQVRQVSPQIRQEELRQVSSQIRQVRSQIRQISPQIRQISSGLIEKPASNEGPAQDIEESENAKNTYIRINNHNNTDRNEFARERWAPVDRSFHPRLINIAQAAGSAWREKDYKCDRALWNSAVEQIAVERGEQEAVRFVTYVKDAHGAWGRKFPYSPQLMQEFLDKFRAGESWSLVLGPGYEEAQKVEAPSEGENADSGPGFQNQALDESNPGVRGEASPMQMEPAQADSGCPESGSGPAVSAEPTNSREPRATGAFEFAQEPRVYVGTPMAPIEAQQETSAAPKKSRPVQLTHANLLDFPARSSSHQPATDRPRTQEAQAEKKTIETSPRRRQLLKAVEVLTFEMKSQSKNSLMRGFAKLEDAALYETLCRLFGAERLKVLVP